MEKIKSFVLDKQLFFKDKERYLSLINSFYKANGDDFSNLNIEEMIVNKNVFYSLVMNGNNVVCLCRFAKMCDRKTMYCIRQINTLENYQHKGYAVMCYSAILNYVKSQGGRRIVSFVANGNKHSQELHRKCGYKEIIPSKVLKKTNYYFEDSCCYEKHV